MNINDLCPWCKGRSLYSYPIADKRGLGGLSHFVECDSCAYENILGGEVPQIPKGSTVGYKITPTDRKFILRISRPQGGAYRLTMYRHDNGSTYIACQCTSYAMSGGVKCKHTDLAYRWLARLSNVEACKRAWEAQEVAS